MVLPCAPQQQSASVKIPSDYPSLPLDYDVAIIGAGPAGCACALALRDSGLRVILVDKDCFPRDKVCGDAIPGPAFKTMDKIDAGYGREMRAFADAAAVRSSVGFAPTGRSLRFDWSTFSYNSRRLSFDDFLIELVRRETGTEILEGARLEVIGGSATGWVCTCKNGERFSAALIVGCDGANSVVARQLAGHDLRAGGSAVRAYFRGIAGVEAGVNEFHFLRELPLGYFWIFPLPDGQANVGLGLLDDRRGRGKKSPNLRESLQRIITTHPALAARFGSAEQEGKIRGFALPFCTKKRPLSGDRFLLCGDAASLVSPLWGHGIDTAMESGYCAARQITDCFFRQDFSAARMATYDALIYRRISRNFLRSRWLLRLVGRFPASLRLLWVGMRFAGPIRWLIKRASG